MNNLLKFIVVVYVFAGFSPSFLAQSDSLNADGLNFQYGMFPKEEPKGIRKINVNGFYRFFATYTNHHDPLLLDQQSNVYASDKVLFIGDDSQLANLWVNVSAKPGPNSSLGFDLFTFQFLDGNLGSLYGTQVADSTLAPNQGSGLGNGLGGNLFTNLGMAVSGNFKTDVGSFKVNLGGTSWYQLSDLTFSSFKGFNRFGLFERNPWDPVQKNLEDRYSTFFQEGAIQQDTRWGNRAFQGLIIDGTNLPGKTTLSLLYGKTEQNGGIASVPNSSTGGRFRKDFKKSQFISFNTFNSRTYTDSLNTESVGFNVHTLEFQKSLGQISVHGEFGAGRYYAPDYLSEWGEAMNLKIKSKSFRVPLELHFFRISPKVINNNALFWNTSIMEYTNTDPANVNPGQNLVLFPFASSVTRVGQMTNNRQGVNLNGEFKLKNFSANFGYGIASEIEGLSNFINYGHPVNGLTRSRMWRWNFPENVGPYNRYNVIYRDVYDKVDLDPFGLVDEPTAKHFNNFEIQLKQKTKLFGRNLYMSFLGVYNTVQKEFSPILVTNEDAYLRLYSSEFEGYYMLTKKVVVSAYLGYERSIANYETNVDLESRRPRNQTGFGLGGGLELALGKSAVGVLRHRIYEFEDESFANDQFKGSETLLEVKIFF